jgi:hypothetical protein
MKIPNTAYYYLQRFKKTASEDCQELNDMIVACKPVIYKDKYIKAH